MKRFSTNLALWALLLSECSCITIGESNPADTLLAGPGVSVRGNQFVGAPESYRSFSDGPFGIGSGVIISSGNAEEARQGGFANQDMGFSGDAICGDESPTKDAAILSMLVKVEPGYNGVEVEFIVGSADVDREPDPVAIYFNGIQYAVDPLGQQITALSAYLNEPVSISYGNSDLQFNRASPPFTIGIPADEGEYSMVFAACDANDAWLDTGLLFNIRGCVDCDPTLKINYVTTTTTVAAGEATGTATVKASGTVSGTFIVTVEEEPETSTTVAEITTTAEQSTATTESVEPTTTSSGVLSETTTQATTTETGLSTTTRSKAFDTTETGTSSSDVTSSDTMSAIDTTTTGMSTGGSTTVTSSDESSTSETIFTSSITVDITASGTMESTSTTSDEATETQTSTVGETDTVSKEEIRSSTSSDASISTASAAQQNTTTLSEASETTSVDQTSARTLQNTSGEGSRATSEETATQPSTVNTETLSMINTLTSSATTDSTSNSAEASETSLLTADANATNSVSCTTDSSELPTFFPSKTHSQLTYPYPTTASSSMTTMVYTKGFNTTKTAEVTTVTTVVYTTVDVNKPGQLTTTYIAVTMGYTPCHCTQQILPHIDMTTTIVSCQSCGTHGSNQVTLTVPVAACETRMIGSGAKFQPKPLGDKRPKPQPKIKQHDGADGAEPSCQPKNQPLASPYRKQPATSTKGSVQRPNAPGKGPVPHPSAPYQSFSNTTIGPSLAAPETLSTAVTPQSTETSGNVAVSTDEAPSYEPSAPIAIAGAVSLYAGLGYIAMGISGVAVLAIM